MSDYSSGSKSYGTSIYPVHANGTSGLLKRVEPLMTPDQFKSRHLKGILELAARFGITYTAEELKDRINLSVNQAEVELGVNVFAEQVQEKHPFDHNLYMNYIHVRTEQMPIISIEDFSIVSSNQQRLFQIPSIWIETGNFHQGLVNVIPILASFGLFGTQAEGSFANGIGVAFLTVLGGLQFIPAYWQLKYTCGLAENAGSVPVVVNELIGTIGAMEILSNIAANNIYNSQSLGQDGISQSSSGPGTQIFLTRMAELEKKKATLIGQIKRVFGRKIFISNI